MTLLHDQTRYPLATLVLVACERAPEQRTRILAFAAREAARRAIERGIPAAGCRPLVTGLP